jgi:hypothetical protein
VSQAAHWSREPKEDNGSVTFELDGEITFNLILRGEHLAAFTADLGIWPQDEYCADELARRLGTLAAGAFINRKSIVSIAYGRYGLHLAFDPVKVDLIEVPELCTMFLNDLDWWRTNASIKLTA